MLGIEYLREEREVQLTGYGSQRTTATAELVTFDRRQRLRRAWLGLASWWAMSVVSILIPVAHFALVPGFFLFGMYSFVRRRSTAEVAVSIHGACPDCDHEQAFDPPDSWTDRPNFTCSKCHRSLRGSIVDG